MGRWSRCWTGVVSRAALTGALVCWGVVVTWQVLADVSLGGYLASWRFSSWAFLPEALLRHAARLAGLLGLSALLAGTGRWLLGRLSWKPHNPWEGLAFSFGLGYGAWGSALFLLGMAGLWRRWLLAGCAALLFVPAAACARGLVAEFRGSLRRARPAVLTVLSAASFWGIWLHCLRYAMVPETFYDALVCHLALPARYLLEHRILPVPENSYAGIPALPQMLYGLTLAYDSWGISASMLHHSMLLWVACAMLGLARRLGVREAGAPACAMFSLAPVVIAESFQVSVGMEWALFQLLFLAAFLAVPGSPAGSGERRGWLVVCGVFLGLAMATKYLAWVMPPAFLGALVCARWAGRRGAGPRLGLPDAREAGVALAVAAAVVAPWVARNVLFYGNPAYPFFSSLFGSGAGVLPDWRQIADPGARLGMVVSWEGLKGFLLHPWHFLRPVMELNQSTGPLYLSLLPLLVLAPAPRQERLLAWFCLAAWVMLWLLSPLTRFFIPLLAALSVLLAAALSRGEAPWLRGPLVAWSCAAGVSIGAIWVVLNVRQEARQEVLLGLRPYAALLGHTAVSYPTPPYAGFEYVNARAEPDARVLLLGDSRSFHLRRPAVASSVDHPAVLETWANASADGSALWGLFHRNGIRYVVENRGEMFRTASRLDLSETGLRSLRDFWRRHALKEFEDCEIPDRCVAVYRILDSREAAQPHAASDFFSSYRVEPR
ncbi:MAG: hypothetical protein HY927_15885 [Elusimicrobia bacterium]|nr:hypothetical protein [Elusimicrobiota bacterium]